MSAATATAGITLSRRSFLNAIRRGLVRYPSCNGLEERTEQMGEPATETLSNFEFKKFFERKLMIIKKL